ncbi:MAG TPA: tRNA preQ1(34) S-adenosylmethionine ribosyltransferase-isomerase QueA [Alphaproteobacteria bacterium]|nr:tRNA preQ1(34) S-adenosylmethionine ribosyltransferase-isomerase QueA [Alphaproteobacteria bacterium]
MPIGSFDFDLPRELIASRPVRPRDAARLLHVTPRTLSDHIVRELPQRLQPGDLLVLNDTKVIPARLAGMRGAAKIELTLHRQKSDDCWRAFAKPARKLKIGDRVDFAEDFGCEIVEKGGDGEVALRFDRAGPALFAAFERHGVAPLPPYIKRAQGPDAQDSEDYQTIFARHPGAVAAPTAGLHFTEELVAALEARGVKRTTITLHVGAGTFLPVKVDDLREHRMHSEHAMLSSSTAQLVNDTKARGGRIVAVGSTSLRVLETAANEQGDVAPFAGETDLFIMPDYRFRIADVMLTNFHLPRSTLFVLVSAFAGLERMRAAYRHAIAAGYRFYSYGDCCLIERSGAA